MKKCMNCAHIHRADLKKCDHCGQAPAVIGGFKAYAPALAREGGGFKASYFTELARLEEANFWFRARNRIVIWAAEKYAPDFSSLLEVGCGTGFVLSGLSKRFPDARFVGSEIFVDGLPFALQRVPSAELMQMDARQIPFVDEFDVVGAFDVLEHIKEDEIVLRELHSALKPGGVLLVSVPQHAWLWSAADDYACHERRYSAAELRSKIEKAGFDVLRSTSFVTTLFPAMVLSRLMNRGKKQDYDPTAEFTINPLLNAVFEKMLGLELACIKRGLNFPFGGSRLMVAKKRAGE
ncbi:class I SAM-dependent methyltransferase [Roseobacter sp. YSTF-M11]|uniref:Class I SAM-dependent methyltransferase n=1 Tax=Roseobacter insulae TaxID=2859783 RepID=A0A9X1G0S6_9RHOB|nr:class I SAM-dependent methyltransferase [Roseobacter insulae]MBW4710824.1 class I SAM-dependent methyltransferase [Roseobacter insulae]